MREPRRIGPIGTTVRVLAGVALLALALADRPAGVIGGLELYELMLGLVVFPGVMVAIGLAAGCLLGRPLRLTGPDGMTVNFGALLVLFALPYTAGAAALFYGTSLLVAAWRGAVHCEVTVLSNLFLGRDDQIGCPTMTPIDALEARRRRTAART